MFALVHIKMTQLKDMIKKEAELEDGRKDNILLLFDATRELLHQSSKEIMLHEKYANLNDEILKDRYLIQNELNNLP